MVIQVEIHMPFVGVGGRELVLVVRSHEEPSRIFGRPFGGLTSQRTAESTRSQRPC